MPSGGRILCVGAAHWDTIGRSLSDLGIGDDAPGTIERRLGGVALNVAVGLARHGQPVNLCSAVGRDGTGTALIRELDRTGVDCTNVLRIDRASTDHYIAIEDGRGNLFAAIADASLLEDHADAIAARAEAAVRTAKAVVLDANLPPPCLLRIAVAAADAGVQIVANPASPAKAQRLTGLLSPRFAPTLVANLGEAIVMLGRTFPSTHGAAKALQARTAGIVLVTQGASPVALATPAGVSMATPVPALRGASVTGAGDALLAAFLASDHQQDRPQAALECALQAAADHMSRQA